MDLCILIVGLIGLLSVFLSTRYAVGARIAAERPLLVSGIGGNPDGAIWFFMLLGNTLAGFAGAVYGGVAGSVSTDLADDKMFLGLTSLILGESLLTLCLFLPSRLFWGAKKALVRHRKMAAKQPNIVAVMQPISVVDQKDSRRGVVHFLYNKLSLLSGTDSVWLLLAAMLGSPAYWLLFNHATGLFHIGAYWNKLVLALAITIFLIITNRLGRGTLLFSEWSFHERKSW